MPCNDNIPFALENGLEIQHRINLLQEPHMRDLTVFVNMVKNKTQKEIPYFDPCDGGVNSKALFLLEAPGKKALRSGFISRNNHDQTARNMLNLLNRAGLNRQDTLLWNVIPWYSNPVTNQDLELAKPYLKNLLEIIRRPKAIVLVGRKAQKYHEYLNRVTDLIIFETFHPSPLNINTRPEMYRDILDVFKSVSRYLNDERWILN